MAFPIAAIFISSTWLDLQPERKVVAEALHRFHEAKFIGMEYFGSRDETTLDVSLDEVDRAQLYVGIFAGRYGSGITEAEYRRARQQGLDCLIYLKDETVLQDNERDADELIKLIALKDELRANHTATIFRDANELAAKVTADLHRWLFSKFLRSKPDQARAEPLYVPLSGMPFANGDNGFRFTNNADHGAVADSAVVPAPTPRPRPLRPSLRPFPNLVDRKSETAEAFAALTNPSLIEITGPLGIGKTALLRHLAYHAEAAKFPAGVIYCSQVGRQSAADLLQFIFDTFYDSAQLCHPRAGALLQLLRDQKALILIDDVQSSVQELDPVLNALSDSAIVLATTSRMSFDAKTLYLRGLPVDDAVELIEREYAAPLSDSERLAAKDLVMRLGQSPAPILHVVAELREQRKSLAACVAQMPVEADVIDQLASTRSPAHRKVLAALSVAGVPLSKSALAAMTSLPHLDDTLTDLLTRRLVEAQAHGFAAVAHLAQADSQSGATNALMESLLRHCIAELETSPVSLPRPHDGTAAIERVLAWAADQQRWPEVLHLCRAVEPIFANDKQWGVWQDVLILALQAAERSGDGAAVDWADHQLGSRALCLGDVAVARRHLLRSLAGRISRGDHWGAAVTQHNLDLLELPLAPQPSAPTDKSSDGEDTPSLWSRFIQLPLALRGTLLALLCTLVALIANYLTPPPPTPMSVSFSPNLLEFRSSAIHVPALAQVVTVTNKASSSLALGAVSLVGAAQEDFFINENSCRDQILAAGSDCRISVIFTPSARGPRVAALTLSDQARRDTVQLPLRGLTGLASTVESGQMELAPSPFDLGVREVGSGITSSATLTNSGNAPLKVVEISIAGDHRQDFSDGESECRQKILPQRMSCVIPITFTPSGTGVRNATLTVIGEDGSKEELPLRGNGAGVNPRSLTARPGQVNFAAVEIGQRVTQQIILHQQGRSAIEISAISIEGAAKKDFVVSQNDCLTGTSEENRSCQLGVTFTPTSPGFREANLLVANSGSPGQLRIALEGSGTLAGSRVSLSPEPLEFTEQAIDSPPVRRSVTLRNSGAASVAVGRPEILGPDARQFALSGNNCGDRLAGQQVCQITVRYAPKAVGRHRAVLRIEPLGGGPREITLRGAANIVQKSLATVTPERLSFVEMPIGRSRVQEIRIENRGQSDLVIRRAVIRGAPGFMLLDQCNSAIKPATAPCVLRIRFTPQSSGSHDAELIVAHNGDDSPLRVPIEGAARELAVVPGVSVIPRSLSFGPQAVGTTSQSQLITVGSSGTVNLNIGTIAIGGTNNADFRIVKDGCSRREIAPGGRCELTLVFAPQPSPVQSRRGERAATLVLPHNAANSRSTIGLSGVATARPTGTILR